jgi:hypothetical protein
MAALRSNAMLGVKLVHCIESPTQAARRDDDVNVVRKFLLGSRCSKLAFVAGHWRPPCVLCEVTVTGREGLTMMHQCLLSRSLLGVKRTWVVAVHMSASDPKRTCRSRLSLKPKSLSLVTRFGGAA